MPDTSEKSLSISPRFLLNSTTLTLAIAPLWGGLWWVWDYVPGAVGWFAVASFVITHLLLLDSSVKEQAALEGYKTATEQYKAATEEYKAVVEACRSELETCRCELEEARSRRRL